MNFSKLSKIMIGQNFIEKNVSFTSWRKGECQSRVNFWKKQSYKPENGKESIWL